MSPDSRQIVSAFKRLAMYWRAGQWQAAKDNGLNPTQGEVLQRAAAQPARASDLAAELGITPASLSDTVSALVAKALVTRCPDREDKRARRIEATDAGRRVAEQMPEAPEALQAAIAELGGDERGALLRAFTLIIRSLQEARAIPVQQMCITCHHFRPNMHDDAARPHHCMFVDAAFGDAALRLDCADHETATEEEAARARARFTAVG